MRMDCNTDRGHLADFPLESWQSDVYNVDNILEFFTLVWRAEQFKKQWI